MAYRKFDIGKGYEESGRPKPDKSPDLPRHDDFPTPQPQIVPHTPDIRKGPSIPPSMLPTEMPETPKKPEEEWVNQNRSNIGDL